MKMDKVHGHISQSAVKDYIEDMLEEAYGERDVRKITDTTIGVFVQKVLPKLEREFEDALLMKHLKTNRTNLLSFLRKEAMLDAFLQAENGTT